MHEIGTPFSTHIVEERNAPEALRRMAFRFASNVAPGEVKTLTRRVPRDGTVEAVRVRIYPGAELSVQVRPYVIDERDYRRDLVAYVEGGKDYIDGDDDVWTFSIREPIFQNGDTLKVEIRNTLDPTATNADGTLKYPADLYTYAISVDIEVDFAAGPWPLLGVVRHG